MKKPKLFLVGLLYTIVFHSFSQSIDETFKPQFNKQEIPQIVVNLGDEGVLFYHRDYHMASGRSSSPFIISDLDGQLKKTDFLMDFEFDEIFQIKYHEGTIGVGYRKQDTYGILISTLDDLIYNHNIDFPVNRISDFEWKSDTSLVVVIKNTGNYYSTMADILIADLKNSTNEKVGEIFQSSESRVKVIQNESEDGFVIGVIGSWIAIGYYDNDLNQIYNWKIDTKWADLLAIDENLSISVYNEQTKDYNIIDYSIDGQVLDSIPINGVHNGTHVFVNQDSSQLWINTKYVIEQIDENGEILKSSEDLFNDVFDILFLNNGNFMVRGRLINSDHAYDGGYVFLNKDLEIISTELEMLIPVSPTYIVPFQGNLLAAGAFDFYGDERADLAVIDEWGKLVKAVTFSSGKINKIVGLSKLSGSALISLSPSYNADLADYGTFMLNSDFELTQFKKARVTASTTYKDEILIFGIDSKTSEMGLIRIKSNGDESFFPLPIGVVNGLVNSMNPSMQIIDDKVYFSGVGSLGQKESLIQFNLSTEEIVVKDLLDDEFEDNSGILPLNDTALVALINHHFVKLNKHELDQNFINPEFTYQDEKFINTISPGIFNFLKKDTTVVVGGLFDEYNGVTAGSLVSIDPKSGEVIDEIVWPFKPGSRIYDLFLINNALYVGGQLVLEDNSRASFVRISEPKCYSELNLSYDLINSLSYHDEDSIVKIKSKIDISISGLDDLWIGQIEQVLDSLQNSIYRNISGGVSEGVLGDISGAEEYYHDYSSEACFLDHTLKSQYKTEGDEAFRGITQRSFYRNIILDSINHGFSDGLNAILIEEIDELRSQIQEVDGFLFEIEYEFPFYPILNELELKLSAGLHVDYFESVDSLKVNQNLSANWDWKYQEELEYPDLNIDIVKDSLKYHLEKLLLESVQDDTIDHQLSFSKQIGDNQSGFILKSTFNFTIIDDFDYYKQLKRNVFKEIVLEILEDSTVEDINAGIEDYFESLNEIILVENQLSSSSELFYYLTNIPDTLDLAIDLKIIPEMEENGEKISVNNQWELKWNVNNILDAEEIKLPNETVDSLVNFLKVVQQNYFEDFSSPISRDYQTDFLTKHKDLNIKLDFDVEVEGNQELRGYFITNPAYFDVFYTLENVNPIDSILLDFNKGLQEVGKQLNDTHEFEFVSGDTYVIPIIGDTVKMRIDVLVNVSSIPDQSVIDIATKWTSEWTTNFTNQNVAGLNLDDDSKLDMMDFNVKIITDAINSAYWFDLNAMDITLGDPTAGYILKANIYSEVKIEDELRDQILNSGFKDTFYTVIHTKYIDSSLVAFNAMFELFESNIYTNNMAVDSSSYEFDYTDLVIVMNAEKEFVVSFYPNPTSHYVRVKTHHYDQHNLHLKIYSMSGEEMKHSQFEDAAGNAVVDISELPNGIYVISVFDRYQLIKTERLQVQH